VHHTTHQALQLPPPPSGVGVGFGVAVGEGDGEGDGDGDGEGDGDGDGEGDGVGEPGAPSTLNIVGMLAVPMVTGGLGVTESIRTTFVTLEAPMNEKRPFPALLIIRGQMIVFAPEGSAVTVTTRLLLLVTSPPSGSPTE